MKQFRQQPGLLSLDDDKKALRTEAMLLQHIRHPSMVQALCMVLQNCIVDGYAMELLDQSLEPSCRQIDQLQSRECSSVAKFFRHARSGRAGVLLAWSFSLQLLDQSLEQAEADWPSNDLRALWPTVERTAGDFLAPRRVERTSFDHKPRAIPVSGPQSPRSGPNRAYTWT